MKRAFCPLKNKKILSINVLIEEKAENDIYTGFSDNYIRCYVKGEESFVGKIMTLKIKEKYSDGFMCEF